MIKREPYFFSSRKLIKLALALICIFSIIFTNCAQRAQAAGGPLKVVGRFLQDSNGNNIMMRGVNMPVYKSGWADDLNTVAAAVATTKTNAARLEWWANPPAGTTEYTDANFDRAIQKYADLGILPIVELHDLTYQYGHNDKAGGAHPEGNSQTLFANTITNFWTRAAIKTILIKHQNHIVINLANEWGSAMYSDDTSTAANFIQNYTNAITAMRTAGINAPLMVDAPSGFEYQFILDNGQAILNADPQGNTMLSIHAYWAASGYSDANINTILNNIKNSGLPIILGEVSSNAWTDVQCDPVHYGNMLTTANTDGIGYLFWAWYEDGTCGTAMNITVNADGVTVPTAANPGFGYNALNGTGYGINTANPATIPIPTSSTSNGSKVLTTGRAIATWSPDIPAGEKRPVLVFLPGWDGVGAVTAVVSAQNLSLVNEGYVTLAIGFDSNTDWISDIDVKTKAGLDKLCADASIPADCSAIALVGESYGGSQNYWGIEYLRGNGYDGSGGSTGNALAFLSEDTGYGAPGNLDDPNTGAFTRTGLANTVAYSVAMIENLGDTTFPVDDCTWGNCGARVLSNAHIARGDHNVFSICPPGGEHGARGYAQWDEWVISAIKTMLHTTQGVPTFTGYTAPTLTVSNACVNIILPGVLSVARADANPSNAANAHFTVTFSKDVSGVDKADFTLTTNIGDASVSSVSVIDAATYTVTVATGSSSGMIRLDVLNDGTIKDTDSHALGGAYTSGEVYTIDKTPPHVITVNPFTNGSANFIVKFSESVNGVDAGDFTFTLSGVSGASIKSVSGSGAMRAVAVNPGSGNGTIRLNVSNDGTIKDEADNPLSSGFTGGKVLNKKSAAFDSTAAKDGWTLESSEFSNVASTKNTSGTLRVGDDARNRQYRSLLYFDTANLPNNAVISKVTVNINKAGLTGNDPFVTHGILVADMKKGFFGLSPLLELADFNAAAAPISNAGTFTTGDDTLYQLTLSPLNFKYINLLGVTQFRLRFTKDDNNDRNADFITFYRGEVNPPELIIEYTVP